MCVYASALHPEQVLSVARNDVPSLHITRTRQEPIGMGNEGCVAYARLEPRQSIKGVRQNRFSRRINSVAISTSAEVRCIGNDCLADSGTECRMASAAAVVVCRTVIK